MKYTALILLSLFAHSLFGQIQVLPDLEVSGESRVKIFLYKKALPYNKDSLAGDSLRAYLPLSLPEPKSGEILLLKVPMRHYMHAEASSRISLDADYRYTPAHQNISLGLGAALYSPKGNLLSNQYRGFANFVLPSGEDLSLQARYYMADGNDLNSDFASAELHVYKDIYRFNDFDLKKMSTSFGTFDLKQRNGNIRLHKNAVNLIHQSVLSFQDFDWVNRLYFYDGNSSWHTYLDIDYSVFDKVSLNMIYDGEYFVPVPGFHWRYITDFDQQFSISNEPETVPNYHAQMLEQYRWLFLKHHPAHAPNTTLPLNLSIRLEDFQPTSSKSFLRKVSVENRSRYSLNHALPTNSNVSGIPAIYFDDVFANESTVKASFGQGSLVFDQSFALSMAYLANQNWHRLPYDPLLKVESALRYEAYPYQAMLTLDQHYFGVDHIQQDLPELFNISVQGTFEIGKADQVYLRLQNLLDSEIYLFKGLPRRGFSLDAGIHHRF